MPEMERFTAGSPVPEWVLRPNGPGRAFFAQDVDVERHDAGDVEVRATREGSLFRFENPTGESTRFVGAPTLWKPIYSERRTDIIEFRAKHDRPALRPLPHRHGS